jgi:peptidoglycan/LPS O-acetylase OafA/YrhL
MALQFSPRALIQTRSAHSGTHYMPVLDGLRGIAVLSVLIGHFLEPYVLTGGGMGVDVFFALSGFLITKLLVGRTERGQQIWGFYFDRMTRLLPPLVLVGLSLFLLPSWLLTSWGAVLNFLGATLYVTNWTRAIPVIGWPNYMAHTWSLSIEEQFYLIWPFVLMLIPAQRRLPWVFALTAAAFLYCFFILPHLPFNRVYNGSDTRVFQLLIGATLAVAPPLRLPNWLSLAALVTLIFIMINVYWSPLSSLTVGLCTCAIISLAMNNENDRLSSKILNSNFLVYFGAISYSLYLWHWPFYWLLTNSLGNNVWYYSIGFAAISIFLAHLTTCFVDLPMMHVRRITRPAIKTVLGRVAFVQLAGGLVLGLFIFYSGILKVAPY